MPIEPSTLAVGTTNREASPAGVTTRGETNACPASRASAMRWCSNARTARDAGTITSASDRSTIPSRAIVDDHTCCASARISDGPSGRRIVVNLMSAHHRRERCNKYFLTAIVPTISGIFSFRRRTRWGTLRGAPDQVLQDAHLRGTDSLVARAHIHMRQLSSRTRRLSIVVQTRPGHRE